MIAKHETREYANPLKVSLTLYANPSNVPHWHYDWELIYLEEGSLEIFLGEQLFVLNQKQAALIPGTVEHSVLTSTPSRAYVLFFPKELLDSSALSLELASPLLNGEYDYLHFLSLIQNELSQKSPLYGWALSNAINSFFLRVYRDEGNHQGKANVFVVSPFMRLIEDIDERYSEYSSRMAADFLHMNPSYFSRYFHQKSGLAFSRYLNSVRVEKAVALLKKDPDIKLADCAFQCGFETIRNFNRVFKEVTGFSPSSLPADYRYSANAVYYGDSSSFIHDHFNPTLETTSLLKCWE